MASPYNFVTIADQELDDPEAFLPTSLRFDGDQVFWTKPGYATYRGTPVNFEMADATILCDPSKVKLPPNLQRISESESITEYQQRYIYDYKFAAATIDHWRQNKHPDEENLAKQVTIWKQTCDKLVISPHFGDGWFLPAFYPIYSYQCFAGLQNFFTSARDLHPNKPESFWKQRAAEADEMFNSWEALYHYVASSKLLPFPKCLWYHKYQYVFQRNQPKTWRDFFNSSSPFGEWGKTNYPRQNQSSK